MSTAARKRDGGEIVFPSNDDKKKRRKETKKTSSFKPQSLAHSSDTPPEDQSTIDIPPPPSEKRIARRRDSTRAIRERAASTSPTSNNASSKRQKMLDDQPESSTSSNIASSSVNTAPMGPPTFIRKTRKSMRGLSVGPPPADDSVDSMVPLAENETPMIKKNKELREAQSRRSSFGMRGQRASSSLGRGEISIPHNSVDHKLFYTHLGSSMPEPIRARHLIAWCAKRAADVETGKKSKTKGKDRTTDGDRMVREIMEEVVMSLGKGAIDTNVFAQVPSGSSGLLRPHPKNVANKRLHDEADVVIKRSKAENDAWARLINRTNARLHATINRTKEKKAKDEQPSVVGSGWMEDALKLADGIIKEGEGDLMKMGEFSDVEFKVDSLLSSTHVAVQYSRQSQLFLDGIFSSLTADLRSRENPTSTTTTESDIPDPIALLAQTAKPSTSKAKGKGKEKAKSQDPMLMLRALASADSKSQDEEAIAAAARVAPVTTTTTTTNTNTMSISVGPGVTATPRRIGQATPRRIGQNGPTPKSARGRVAEEAE